MDEFIKALSDNSITANEANTQIIDNLMKNNLYGNDKCNNYLYAYDSESLFNNKLYISNMYIFEYHSKFPVKYTYNNQTCYFTDTLPIVFMTGQTQNCLRGINLNFCTCDLKKLIINNIMNLDWEHYSKNIYNLIKNRNIPLSDKVFKYFTDKKNENDFIENLNRSFENVNYSMLFRNYAISEIKNIRLIEPWQWQFIPYIEYEGSLRAETLKAIQVMNGFDKVKI